MRIVVNAANGRCYPTSLVKRYTTTGQHLEPTDEGRAMVEALEAHPEWAGAELLTWPAPNLATAERLLAAAALVASIAVAPIGAFHFHKA
mgnify:CR=1 FL=1